ncbi:MAG TPA: cell envelope integrity protein CreD [Cyclobacteriaceae bacterium]|nr:cell envelope integrity protein CreD [Cyclobacteriaceae bacterium]
METNQNTNLFDRLNHWLKESITIKLLSIGFLILILLIPSSWIKNLIEERQQRAESVINEISDKWSGSQNISGPVLVIPYKHQETIYTNKEKEKIEIRESTRRVYFLPDQLHINGNVNPIIRHRGIFDAVVYTSEIEIHAEFKMPDFNKLEINENQVLWNEAKVISAISDLRGITADPVILAGKQTLHTEPTNNVGIMIKNFTNEVTEVFAQKDPYAFNYSGNGITSQLNWNSGEDFENNFSINLQLKGSNRLSFIPTGKTTTVSLKGSWEDPSFEGTFLPEDYTISEKQFSANWKILHYNRALDQQWTEENLKLGGNEFGLKLLLPVDQYQKSIRTSKYSHLIILLTFIALFLVEIIQKVRIHPFQYILIGAALIIYYSLLLSLSEQIGYNMSYFISGLATALLISTYSFTFLRQRKLVWLLASLLMLFYSFIFIIIIQQDFSLLIGSIGLFIMVATLMYFSRKVDWYKTT